MKKIFSPVLFVSTLIAGLLAISSCKKCQICTVKDTNTGHVLYISPEKCGSETDFAAQQAKADSFYCWACAVYDTVVFDSIPDATDSTIRYDSAYVANLDSLGVDSLDSINCGQAKELSRLKYKTGTLIRALTGQNYFVRCYRGNKFPTNRVCD